MTLSHSLPCNHPLFATPLTFCIPYQMLLTSLVRKLMYSYISENDFGSSNQIIVPTGYKADFLIMMHLDSYNTDENTTLPPYLSGYPLKHEEYSSIWVTHKTMHTTVCHGTHSSDTALKNSGENTVPFVEVRGRVNHL